MKIYVIRHGETVANTERRFCGQLESPLNENGRSLAVETGRGMQGIRFDLAVTSPLSRAKETAEIILRESGNTNTVLQYDDRLKELDCGLCEGVLVDSEGPYRTMMQQFFKNPMAFTPMGLPEGETLEALCARTQAVLREVAALPYQTVLLSTHGCAVRAMLNCFYSDPTDFWHGHVPYNCAVNIIEATDGKLRLSEEDKIYYDASKCVDRFAVK